MNIGFLSRIPWLPLILVWMSYALLGWYLSAYHIFWLVGAFVAAVALGVAWKNIPWLERLLKFGSQSLFVVLIISVLVALAAKESLLLTLIVMPSVTTFLAEIEMRFAGFSKPDTFFFNSLSWIWFGFGRTDRYCSFT